MNKTTLYNAHEKSGARFVDFAGWTMPQQYESITKEHLWCRQKCAIFDTSHMAKFTASGKDVAVELGTILTSDPVKLNKGRCRYCFLLNEKAGLIDDVVLYAVSTDEYMLVANAANKEKDFEWISARLTNALLTDSGDCLDKIDVQGPLSHKVLQSVFGIDVSGLPFYSFGSYGIFGAECIVSHSGYTGDRGYEIYTAKEKTEEAWNALLQDERVRPAGLGARDTLRLEAGLPLYGQDLDEETTPVEAGLKRFVDFSHPFVGREALERKSPGRKMVFLLSLTRQAPRRGHEMFVDGDSVGVVTSGSFSPSLQKGVGIAYLRTGKRIPENGILATGISQGPKINCSVITKRQLQRQIFAA